MGAAKGLAASPAGGAQTARAVQPADMGPGPLVSEIAMWEGCLQGAHDASVGRVHCSPGPLTCDRGGGTLRIVYATSDARLLCSFAFLQHLLPVNIRAITSNQIKC